MKPVHVLILAVLVALAGLVVWYTDQPDGGSGTEQALLLPGLAEALDAVDRVSLRDANESAVTIEKKNGDWLLSDKPNYYVDASKLGKLLIAASEVAPVELKTANPDMYSRLGLRDVSDSKSGAVLLAVSAGGKNYELLVGNRSDRFGGSMFVRRPGEAQSYLAAPVLEVDVSADDWLDKLVLDFQADEVQSVRIARAGGDIAEIRKDAMFNAEFDLVDREENQVLDDARVRGLARGLVNLRFEDVRQSPAFAFNDYERMTVTYTLFSGVVIELSLFSQETDEASAESDAGPTPEPQFWLNASARFDEAVAQQFVPQPTGDDAQSTTGERLTLTSADLADRRQQVERLNKTRKPWVYKISKARFDSMNQTADSLITAEE